MIKRGQVYILAVLLLAFVIIGLSISVNVVQKYLIEDDFEELSADYERESAKFINTIVGIDICGLNLDGFSEKFLEFTVDFTRYSKTQNLDFGLIYLFDFKIDDSNHALFVGNYLDQEILVGSDIDLGSLSNTNFETNLGLKKTAWLEGCRSKIKAGVSFLGFGLGSDVDLDTISTCNASLTSGSADVYDISFFIGDFLYSTKVMSGVPELVIVSKEFKDEQRKVFISDRFLTGNYNLNQLKVLCTASVPPTTIEKEKICDCNARTNFGGEVCVQQNGLCEWVNGQCSKVP